MQPVKDLLSRESKEEVGIFLATIADSIDETINFGTHIFEWFEESVAGKGDEAAPIAMSFKHLLEMLDSVSVLVRNSIIEPTKSQLRSALEAAMAIAWILQEDSECRAMAFMVWNVHEELKWYQRLDEQTLQGKEFKQKLKGTSVENVQSPPSVKLKKARKSLETLLTEPKYRVAEEEYQKLRGQRIKNPSWYRLFDGPQNIEQLAARVEMTEWYELLYRQWSGVVHATDLLAGKVKFSEGKTYIQKMRCPDDAETVYTFTISIALKIYEYILKCFIPSKVQVFVDWYASEVRDLYMKISSENSVLVRSPLS